MPRPCVRCVCASCSFEECNQYDQAETFGMQAVNMDPTDAWAIHAGECCDGSSGG